MPSQSLKHFARSVWDIAAAKHAAVSQEPAHATVVAYLSDEDPWSASMRNSTLACKHLSSSCVPSIFQGRTTVQAPRAPLCSIVSETGGNPAHDKEMRLFHKQIVLVLGSSPVDYYGSLTEAHCAGLHRFYRARDLVFVVVHYEHMSLNEQMQHRIGNLPAFRIFSQVIHQPAFESGALYRTRGQHQLCMHTPCAPYEEVAHVAVAGPHCALQQPVRALTWLL